MDNKLRRNSPVGSIYTLQSRESKIVEDNSSIYIAVSPDGQIAATFNSESYTINVYRVRNLATPVVICYDEIRKFDLPSVKVSYSLAVSNLAKIGENEDVLIAISCFCDNDMMTEMEYGDYNPMQISTDTEKGDDFKTNIPATTFVISTILQSRIKTPVDTYGGVVRFLDNNVSSEIDQSNGFTNLIVLNASGIIKVFIFHKNSYAIEKRSYESLQEYEFPTIVQSKIDKLYQEMPCTGFLQSSVESNYLFVEDYRNQRVEMYNLQSLDLEMAFQKRDETSLLTQSLGNHIFSVSKFGHLLAHCGGTKSITIYLMENGLEIVTKNFSSANRILFISFIDDDEKLFIVTEETSGYSENGRIRFASMIIVWDLFNFKNDMRKVTDNANLFSSFQRSIVCSKGTILAYLQDGTVLSILGLSDIKRILKPSNASRSLSSLNIKQAQENSLGKIFHTLFLQDGKWVDAKKEQKRVIVVNNKEPWVHYKQYRRISSYLDENKTIQLIIGETTVQVWRKKGHGSQTKRVLEYIWASSNNKRIQIISLEVGNCEFSLDISIPSTIFANLSQNINIHWPSETHTLKDACGAIEYLYDRRDEPVGPKNQSKYEELVMDTEKLIKKCIKKNPDLWRLSEIRYEIMDNLIRAKRVLLIHQILFDHKADQANTRVSRYLHTPRQYSWPVEEKRSDLEVAIENSSGEHRKDTVIIAMLLEYYSNNAEKNTGWMFTITKALPLLNQRHLDFYLKELLYKPCFGAKEESLDLKFVPLDELKKGYAEEVYSLKVEPRLLKKQEKYSWWNVRKKVQRDRSNRTNNETTQVTTLRVVPLPDFTVFPTNATEPYNNWIISLKLLKIILWPRGYLVQNDRQRSPFLKLIRENENEILYDNPAIEACIKYKWNAARNHFLRHCLIYVAFALIFAIVNGIINDTYINGSDSIVILLYFAFFYLGYYLLATEFVQLKYEGFKRYWSIYNILDLGSVIISMIVLIYDFTIKHKWDNIVLHDNYVDDPNDINQYFQSLKDNGVDYKQDVQGVTITQAFAVLLLWFELLLLMRYFSGPATYINMIINILKAVWPFLCFMVVIIIAFGHAMHILLQNPKLIGLEPDGSSFIIESKDKNQDFSDISVSENFDVTKPIDNFYVSFGHSIMAVFFWMLGRWDQLEVWDFWPIHVLSIVASILLVIILQNMLVAFMTGIFDDATSNVKLAVLKYRADLIADYEALDKPFGSRKGNPRYIYYIGDSEYQEEWLEKAEKYRKAHKSLLVEDINNQLKNSNFGDDSDDDDDDSYGDNKFLIVKDTSNNRNNNDQKVEFNVEEQDSIKLKPVTNEKVNEKFLELQDEMKKMQNDVTGRLNVVEENLKEILSFIKRT